MYSRQAFLSVIDHDDPGSQAHIDSIVGALETLGYQAVCTARETDLSAEARVLKTFAAIEASDLVVADLTEESAGVGVEAGYAYAKGKPVWTIARQGSDIPAGLRGISTRVAWYKDYAEIGLLLAPREQRTIGAA